MTRYFRRRRPELDDTLRAAALGLGVGAATGVVAFYFTRLFLTREVLGSDGVGYGNPAEDSVGGEGRRSSRRGGSAGS